MRLRRRVIAHNGKLYKLLGLVSALQYEDRELRRLQLLELRILQDIDRVCDELGITYFLDSGSVLGALRHRGFIPWDDDIDLGMPRADYERFVHEAPKLLGDEYVVSTPEINPSQAALFCKVWLRGTRFATEETIQAGFNQGIFVDIFPYDALSRDEKLARKQRRACRFWQSVSYLYHAKSIVLPHDGVVASIEHLACGFAHVAARALFTHDKIVSSFNRAATLANDAEQAPEELVVMVYSTYKPYKTSMMLPPSMVLFEGHEFSAPAQSEAFLCQLYGDWRELPPVGKRRNHAPVELDFGDIEPR